MSSNYPPGVTGHEPEIAGSDIQTISGVCTADARDLVPLHLAKTVAVGMAKQGGMALGDALYALLDASEYSPKPCSFEGFVEGVPTKLGWIWTCPHCGTMNKTEEE